MTDYEINGIEPFDDGPIEPIEPDEPIEPEPPVIHTYTLKIEGANDTFAIENLTMNGTNYVADSYVDTSEWPPIFSLTATDEDGNVTESIAHAKLIQQVAYEWDNYKYYLAFAPVDSREIAMQDMAAQIEYLAMMSDIDIDI